MWNVTSDQSQLAGDEPILDRFKAEAVEARSRAYAPETEHPCDAETIVGPAHYHPAVRKDDTSDQSQLAGDEPILDRSGVEVVEIRSRAYAPEPA